MLACAPSNTAADLLALRISSHLKTDELYRLYALSRSVADCPEALLPYCSINQHGVFKFLKARQFKTYRVVVSTCSSAGVVASLDLPRNHFSHIFIDEAGQAQEAEAMIPILAAANAETRVVLAGDPNQLGPVVKSHVAGDRGLRRSYLVRLKAIREVYDLNVNSGVT